MNLWLESTNPQIHKSAPFLTILVKTDRKNWRNHKYFSSFSTYFILPRMLQSGYFWQDGETYRQTHTSQLQTDRHLWKASHEIGDRLSQNDNRSSDSMFASSSSSSSQSVQWLVYAWWLWWIYLLPPPFSSSSSSPSAAVAMAFILLTGWQNVRSSIYYAVWQKNQVYKTKI